MTPSARHSWEQLLHERATAEAQLENFGGDDYLPALRVLLAAIEENELLLGARQSIDTMLVSVLVSRLYSEAGWQARPDSLDAEVRAPVVIVGVPRTGTTILHNLLALDVQFQVLENWLIDQPVPRPAREEWGDYPGYRKATARAAANDLAQRQRHHVEPGDPDECIRLMLQTFVSNMPGSMWPIPRYDELAFTADMRPSFARYKDNLRLISADTPDRTWLLKNPSHIKSLEALLDVFPDARVIQTHRDPTEAIPSLCSLLAGRRRKLGRSFDAAAIGARELESWSTAVAAADEYRNRSGAGVCDVDYRRLVEQPLDVVRSVYDGLELELSAETEIKMRRFLAENPQGKYGKHEYRGAEYGLTEQMILDAFDDYIEQHLGARVGGWAA